MGKTIPLRLFLATFILLSFFPSMGSASCGASLSVIGKINGKWHEINDGIPLRSGQQLRIQLNTVSSCYLEFFWRDSQNQVFNLTPRRISEQTDKTTVPGQVYVLPSNNDLYMLDDSPGSETLVLVTSNSPIIDLNALGRFIARRGFPPTSGSTKLDLLELTWKRISHIED